MSSVQFKFHNTDDDIRRFSLATGASFKLLQEKLEKLLGRPVDGVLKYKDHEGDQITLSSDEELREAMTVAADSRDVIRIVEGASKKAKATASSSVPSTSADSRAANAASVANAANAAKAPHCRSANSTRATASTCGSARPRCAAMRRGWCKPACGFLKSIGATIFALALAFTFPFVFSTFLLFFALSSFLPVGLAVITTTVATSSWGWCCPLLTAAVLMGLGTIMSSFITCSESVTPPCMTPCRRMFVCRRSNRSPFDTDDEDATATNLVDLLPEMELTENSFGLPVAQLQKLLVVLGYLTPQRLARFGPNTKAAVLAYQRAHGLCETGDFDAATAASMRSLLAFNQNAAKPETAAAPAESGATSKSEDTKSNTTAPVHPANQAESTDTASVAPSTSTASAPLGYNPFEAPVVENPVVESEYTESTVPSSTTSDAEIDAAATSNVATILSDDNEPVPTTSEDTQVEDDQTSDDPSSDFVVLEQEWKMALKQLEAMGFHDRSTNIKLLTEYEGDVRRVVLNLVDLKKLV